ncbi:MAG TPA: hypothetical protein VL522_20300 [Bordetella sp.]|nr:hypothetical protein [Bordetella sp.]
MNLNAYLSRRARLAASAACLALLLSACGGSDDSDDTPAEVPIVTNPSPPVADPADACTCAAPNTQRSCAP